MATAAEQTRPETLRWLLDKGADPNAEGINGDRALDWAIVQGRPEQNRPAQALRREARCRNARSLGILRRKALTMPVLRWNGVWRCCFRLRQWSSRPAVALRVITKPCRCRWQRLRARKEYLSTNSCWKPP